MSERDDDRFTPRPAPPRQARGGRGQRFVTRVLRAAGASRIGTRPRRSGLAQGRGQVAARIAGRTLGNNARRVLVKVRLVRVTVASQRGTAVHLRYIERDGVGPQGEPGHAYGPDTDHADLDAFRERSAGDRHQFRIILSPEDGAALGDLQRFTRHWMRAVEKDWGTKTDWVAVDHWNTDNPHTHLVLRGKDQRGRDLVIAPDYLAHGLRARACELATQWLGPRTEREIQASLQREVTQERWTRLDQTLQRTQRQGRIQLDRGAGAPPPHDTLLRGRLQVLTTLGLAEPAGSDAWRLRPDWEITLRRLGERGDIIRTLQRAMGGAPRELTIFDGEQGQRIIGRVASKGLADELADRGYLALDALDGRAYYVALPQGGELDDYPLGAIVEARAGGVRAIDEAITRQTEAGIYRASPVPDPDHGLAQTRRLEALGRAGIVQRLGDGVWAVPGDLPARGRAYDLERLGGATLTLRSHLPIEQQVRALGATWLDQQLVSRQPLPAQSTFGAQVRDALDGREAFLAEQGLAKRQGQRVLLARDLLATLRERELAEVARKIQAETGLVHRPVFDGVRIEGTYRRQVQLVSGRYALLDDGSGFSLVPWRPVVEKRLGHSLAAVVVGHRVSWEFGRTRGISP